MSRQDLSKLADIPKKKTLDSQMSDRKPVGLPFSRKELRTFACFPISQQGRINYPSTSMDLRQRLVSKCRKILNVLCMAGGSALKLETGCYISHLDLAFSERSCVLQTFLLSAFASFPSNGYV